MEELASVVQEREILELLPLCRGVFMDGGVRRYILAIVRTLRDHGEVRLGPSPRASLGLQSACQALAAMRGRGFVTPDDVKHLAVPVLAHRLVITTDARLRGRSAEEVVSDVLARVAVPVES
jgi:MoxR-like ATPase